MKKEIALAAMLMVTWASPLWAYDFITADSLRFIHDTDGGCALLTYAAIDTANVNAYRGDLQVPSLVMMPGGAQLPVKGVTAVACVFCKDLQSVVLSEGIESIGYAAFSDCASLQEVTLPASLTTLSDLSFYRDPLLRKVAVPAGVRRVGDGTFSFCYGLEEVELTDGLSSIAPHAFYHCSSLTSIELPATLTQLGQYAFAYCGSLQRIIVNTPPLAITEDVFEGIDCSECQLVVPHNFYELYVQSPVWQDFLLVDSSKDRLEEVLSDEQELMQLYFIDGVLHILPLGDAPVLVYDLQGRRIAVCPSGMGETTLQLPSAQSYIIRCGNQSRKIFSAP